MLNPLPFIALLIAGISPQEVANPAERSVNQQKIVTLVEKFSGSGEATRFCLGHYDSSAYAVAVCDQKNVVRVIIGRNGRGRIYTLDVKGKDTPGLLLEDLDGDGRSELFVSTSVVEGYQLTDGGLRKFWTSDGKLTSRPAPKVAVADLNGDGRRDVAVLSYKSKKLAVPSESLYVYLQTENAASSLKRSGSLTFTDEHGYHSTAGIAVGNFCGDAQPEIVIGNSNGFLWQLELKDGVPQVRHEWKVPSGGAVGSALAAGNLIGDSYNELLVGTNGGDIFVYRLSEEHEPKRLASRETGRLAYGVGAADVDGDGLQEFVLARGTLGYAGMTEHDVVWEVYKVDHNITDKYTLERVFRKKADDFIAPRLMLHDLNRDNVNDIVLYTAFGKGKRLEFVKPELKPSGK